MVGYPESTIYRKIADIHIPVEILCEVVNYFAEDLSRESIVQIWKEGSEYKVVKPCIAASTKVHISYSFPLNTKGEYIMTIHSHNSMPAYFSDVDDRDELEIPGLYGVIGEIEELDDEYSFSSVFRYTRGLGVRPVMVDMSDLFY